MKGHIRQRGPKTYALVVDLPRGPDGERQQKWHTFHGTKKAAEAELARIIHEINTGSYVEPTALTLGQYLSQWLEDYARVSVAPKTAERYEEIVRLHLIPNLGHIRLSELRPLHIQKYYTRALQSGRKDRKFGGLSAQTVVHHHRVLKQALRHAVRWQLLAANPADTVTPPRPVLKEMKVLSPEQLVVLLDSIRGSVLYIAVLLAVTTGMRRGEILALRWKDIDFETRTASVNRTLVQMRHGLGFKEPKTARSRRVVVLPDETIEALRVHRLEQIEKRLQLGPAYQDGDLVCALDHGAPAAYRLSSDWPKVLKSAGLPHIRFHDLRHTHATMLLKQGIHPKIVSERLGHTRVGITLDTYSHVLPTLQYDAARQIDVLLASARLAK